MVENQNSSACEATFPARETSLELAFQGPSTTALTGVDLTSKSDSDISRSARTHSGSLNSLHEIALENFAPEKSTTSSAKSVTDAASGIATTPPGPAGLVATNPDAKSDVTSSGRPIAGFPDSDKLLGDFEGNEDLAKKRDTLLMMAGGEAQLIAKGPFIDSEELTPGDRRAIENWRLKPEKIREIKRELNEHGKEPQDVIVDAMKKARVIGLGESHIWSANLGTITDSVAKLKEAGATHFAVELSQKEVDEILKTGKDSGNHFNKEEYVAMILAARDAGLKVVGVDNRKVNNGFGPGNEHRDEGMADDIAGILSGDPEAKVVFVVGSSHLVSDGTKTSAAEILKDKFGNDQVVTTLPSDNGRRLQTLTENLDRPVAVQTQDSPELAKLPLTSVEDSHQYGQWDIVIAYPQSQSDPDYGPYEDRMPEKKK